MKEKAWSLELEFALACVRQPELLCVHTNPGRDLIARWQQADNGVQPSWTKFMEVFWQSPYLAHLFRYRIFEEYMDILMVCPLPERWLGLKEGRVKLNNSNQITPLGYDLTQPLPPPSRPAEVPRMAGNYQDSTRILHDFYRGGRRGINHLLISSPIVRSKPNQIEIVLAPLENAEIVGICALPRAKASGR